jgi:hypothetical protein
METLGDILFFLIIAFVYAPVGFGGGSSYLAILAVYALPFKEIRLIALTCIIVVTGGVLIYIKNKQTDWKNHSHRHHQCTSRICRRKNED